MRDMLVIIKTTTERKEAFKALQAQIFKQAPSVDCLFISDGQINGIQIQGKTKYWRLWSEIFAYIKYNPAQHIIQLDDDLQLAPNFFDRLKSLTFQHPDTVINLLTDERCFRANWSHLYPIQYNDYWVNYWVDCIHYMPFSVVERLQFKMYGIAADRWAQNKNMSSGVGKQITQRLNSMGIPIIAPKRSLTYHGAHESVMNTDERINTPLDNSKYCDFV